MKKLSYLFFIFILILCGCPEDDDIIPESIWTKYSGNPVMSPGSVGAWDREFVGLGSVIYHGDKYHMWYSGGNLFSADCPFKIGHATSDDGITWTKDINNPVLDKGNPGTWDETSVHCPEVMVINNTFHMWYTGQRGKLFHYDFQIGHATSPDGTTWTKDPNNPVLPRDPLGAWDHSWISAGSVLFDGTKYHLYYSGCDTLQGGVKIGHATSSDGLTWTKDYSSNPVLVSLTTGSWDIPRVEFPSVLFDGAVYHMWYSGHKFFEWKIGHATSTDGSNWTKDPLNPVLDKGAGSWDSRSVATMSVLDSSGVKYKMWYFGSKFEEQASIGYAEAPHN